MDATASSQTHVTAGLRRAAQAVARAHGMRGDPLSATLLSRGPGILDCLIQRWVERRKPDVVLLAARHGLGLGMARAMVAAVDEMDAHAPEVEIARIYAAMPPEPKARPAVTKPTLVRSDVIWPAIVVAAPAPLPAPPTVRTPAPLPTLPALLAETDDEGDEDWFAQNPDRSHRLRPMMSGWVAVRLMDVAAGLVPVSLAVPGDRPADADEVEARDAFEDAAMAWLATGRASPSPERDRLWFAERPGRRHRLRTPYQAECEGRMPATWTTLACLHLGRVLCLCVDEASLPRGERREDDLRTLFRARAASLAAAHALGVMSEVEEPVADAVPLRVAGSRVEARTAPLALAPPRAVVEDEAPEAGHGLPVSFDDAENPPELSARHGRKQNGGGGGSYGMYESWEERSTARAQSTVWPCMRVDEAFDVVGELLARNGSLPIRAHDVRTACRRFCEDGTAALATLKAFGLLEAGANGMVRVTDLARDGLGRDRAAKGAALAKVATGPAAYRTLAAAVGTTPTVDAIKALPLAKDMPRQDLARLHERFLSAMSFHRAATAN